MESKKKLKFKKGIVGEFSESVESIIRFKRFESDAVIIPNSSNNFMKED